MNNKKKKNSNDFSKSGNFPYSANGIKFGYKMGKIGRRINYQGNEYSCELGIEDIPELNKKNKNENEFKSSTKQAVDKNKLKNLKKRLNLDKENEIKEEKEDDEIKEEKNDNNNSGNKSPPSQVRKNINTVKNTKQNRVILDSEEGDSNKKKEEDKLNNSLEYKNEEKKINKFINDNKHKESKGIKSVGGDNQKYEFKKVKWDEEEYQKLKSEAKNYVAFKEFDANKYLLTLSQMNNIKKIPELYDKYIEFLSLKKKQDKIQMDVLIKNILIVLKNIYKFQTYYCNPSEIKLQSLVDKNSIKKFEFKSNEKTAYFDFFICFMSMYVDDFENLVKITSINEQKKIIVPFYALAYMFGFQAFFRDCSKLIQMYYDKYLAYKIIPIYIKENEEYRYKINSRQIIWK